MNFAMMSTAQIHRFLCHPSGEACPDGCDKPAHPTRREIYESEQDAPKPSGAEELRAIVRWIDYHHESFLDRFTTEQLIALWRYGQAHPCDTPEMADTWEQKDIDAALVPTEPVS